MGKDEDFSCKNWTKVQTRKRRKIEEKRKGEKKREKERRKEMKRKKLK